MKVIHIVENLDTSYGGPARSVPMLVKHLDSLGVENKIFTVQLKDNEKNELLDGLDVSKASLAFSKKIKYAKKLKKMIEKELNTKTIIHVHTMWTYPAYVGYRLAKKHRLPLVVSTRGMIYDWCLKQSRYVKRIAMWVFQKKMLESADVVHITEPSEEKALRSLGVDTPVALVPNGIDVKEMCSSLSKSGARAKLDLDNEKKYLFFISRIHPKKGLEFLVRSWIKIANTLPCWDMLVVGPISDEVYFGSIQKEVKDASLESRFHYKGLLEGEMRIASYVASDLFVLPSHTENFGIVIAEAMAAKLPVITTKGTPWKEIKTHDAGWWVELTQENIDRAIDEAVKISSEEINQKGENGYNLIQQYDWSTQAYIMSTTYKNLLQ